MFTRPPFGWTLSPWHFTRFSEAVGEAVEGPMREAMYQLCVQKGWSKSIKFKLLVYVDDYLAAITHEHHVELAEVAAQVMDNILDEMGIENAFHKAIGPVNVIKWLDLLIDCRPDRLVCTVHQTA